MKMSKIFAIGDIHGRIKALKQCLEISMFDYDKDKLIILGDIADGGYNTYEVVEELLKIKNKVFVLGNHDEWFMNHINSGWTDKLWINQGGANTLNSYGGDVIPGNKYYNESVKIDTRGIRIPKSHIDFFKSSVFYHEENNKLFVHGGFDTIIGLEKTKKETLLWDRDLINEAKLSPIEGFKKIFVGHTTTKHINGGVKPVKHNNLIALDTGCGWTGRLTIMDINSEKYWQSDLQKPAVR